MATIKTYELDGLTEHSSFIRTVFGAVCKFRSRFNAYISEQVTVSISLKQDLAGKGLNRFNMVVVTPVFAAEPTFSPRKIVGSDQVRIEFISTSTSSEQNRERLICELERLLATPIVRDSFVQLAPLYEDGN